MAARSAEIVGAGFAGLAAACALAQRGWRVRVHERSDQLRATGAGIYIYENGLRVLEALGAYDEAVATAPIVNTREVRDGENSVLAVHHWDPTKRVLQHRPPAGDQRACGRSPPAWRRNLTNSEGVSASADGVVALANGEQAKADLIVAADGANSKLRDLLSLLSKRKWLADGATRLLLPRTQEERVADSGTTIEYWSGTRRVLYTPCSNDTIYIALTMFDKDDAAKAIPVAAGVWTGWFPHLSDLIGRIGENGRYDRFEYIKLKHWSRNRVVVLGDAAHALPPNIGQGAGCAMMNALALAVYLDRHADVATALAIWERKERPMTDHTQRASVLFGMPTSWPAPARRAFFHFAGRSKWLLHQRTRTAQHIPTGTETQPPRLGEHS